MKNINLPIITNFNSNNQNNIANRGKSLKTNPSDKRIISKMKRAVSNPKINANNKSKNEETKSFIEEMKNGSFNILVCVRCRPLSSSEKQLSSYETIKIMDKMVILTDPIEYNGPTAIFKNRNKDQTYAFDYAFDKFTKQKTVFEKSTKFLIDGVVNGYNATVFAYGATGAGKTYTMLGTELNPGIMVLTLEELFDKVKGVKLAMICSAVIFVAAVIAALYLRRPAGGTLVEIVQNGKHIATVDLSPRPACNQYSWLRVIRHFEPEMPCIISEPHLILSEIMKYLLKRYMIHITEDKKLLSALSE
jgi:hypothetical protein